MKKFLIILSLIFFSTAVDAREKADTCTYGFVENGSLHNLLKVFSFDKLIIANESKDFYIAFITIEMGNNREINIKECSGIGDGKIILFNGSVTSFDYNVININSSILFNYIGDSNTVTYEATGCGIGYHTPLKVLIFMFDKRVVIGYSIDGSNLVSPLKQIITKYFTFDSQQLFLVLDSISNEL